MKGRIGERGTFSANATMGYVAPINPVPSGYVYYRPAYGDTYLFMSDLKNTGSSTRSFVKITLNLGNAYGLTIAPDWRRSGLGWEVGQDKAHEVRPWAARHANATMGYVAPNSPLNADVRWRGHVRLGFARLGMRRRTSQQAVLPRYHWRSLSWHRSEPPGL